MINNFHCKGWLLIFFTIIFFYVTCFILKNDFYSNAEQTITKKKIGLVKGKFDQIEQLLNYYKIPYETIQLYDLEHKDSLKNYQAVFFPCGIGTSLESAISVAASGYHIQYVQVKGIQKKINMSAISNNIRDFINNGGSGYFSDLSFDLIQQTYNCFSFYHNFPNLGISGRYNVNLLGFLNMTANQKSIPLQIHHEGWVIVKGIADGTILAEGIVNTPKGEAHAIIVSQFRRGKGEFIYSSYHSSSIYDEIMRTLIYRISHKKHINYHLSDIEKWNQSPTSEIVNAILPKEPSRTHTVILKKGKNTIYFFAEKGIFQIDLFTKNNQLVISKDTGKNIFSIDVDAEYTGEYTLSIYGNGNYHYVPYSIVVASGWRLFPHITIWRVILVIIVIFIISVIITAYQLSHPKEIAGRIRR